MSCFRMNSRRSLQRKLEQASMLVAALDRAVEGSSDTYDETPGWARSAKGEPVAGQRFEVHDGV